MVYVANRNTKSMLSQNKLSYIILFILIIGVNFFLPLERSNLKFVINGTEIGLNIVLTLVIFSILLFNKKFKETIKTYVSLKLFKHEMIFLFFMFLSIFFSFAKFTFSLHMILLYIGAYILLVIIFMHIIEYVDTQVLLKIIGYSLILFSLIGIIEIFFNYIIPFYYNLYSDYNQNSYTYFIESGMERANGSLGHPLLYSNLILISFPLVWLIKHNKLKVLILSFIILGIIAGNSRTSIFLFTFVLLVYIFREKVTFKLIFVIFTFITSMVVIYIFPDVFQAIFFRIIDFGSDSSSIARGIYILAGFNRLVSQNILYTIFGNGIGSSKDLLFLEIHTLWPTFDNNYLMILLTIGLCGLSIYLVKYISICKALFISKEFDLLIGILLFLSLGFSFDTLHYSGIIVPHSLLIAIAVNKKAIH